MTDEEVNDAEMIRRPHLWPCWPYLPVKNPRQQTDGWPKLGLIFTGMPTTVVLTDLISCDMDAEKKQYETVEALVADGWMVD